MRNIRVELTLLRHAAGLPALLALLIALAVLAVASGVLRDTERVAARDVLVAEQRLLRESLREMLASGQSADEPGVAARPGTLGFSVLTDYAVVSSTELAPLASGISELMPGHVGLSAHALYLQRASGALDNPLRLAVGSFDLSFVIVFVLPIFVIAVSYDLLSRERELGVLALIAAQGISMGRYIATKLVVRGGLIIAAIAGLNLVALLVLRVAGFSPSAVECYAWLGITISYGLGWYAVAAFVNAWGFGSATNGVVLANVWIVFVIVVPAAVSLAATSLYPPPSRVELTTELREAAAEAEARGAAARERYFFDHPDLAGTGVDQEVYFREVAASENEIAATIEPHLARFGSQADNQASLAAKLRFLSPALLAESSLAAVAGTDRRYYAAFAGAVDAHHGRWREFFVERLRSGRTMTAADWDALPGFGYRAPGEAMRVRSALPAAAALAALCIAVFAAGFWKLRRYSAV